MPEAVTTQGETLWIGTNRSAMRRVPYLVSSPEIAGPVSPIDATNLASDARVYIPGLKDYSGDLVWEANSQRYLPGELRDLLAMDGCKVYAERRMPLVGMRVSLEGTASVSMSAASPDSVQRVTVRIAPTAPMSVEEWSPDMSDGYLYCIRVDDAGTNILRVEASYGGRPSATIVTSSTRQQGAANIPHEWDFNGGVGPFGCFYAAFNVDAYVAGTESEEPICTEAGRLAYRLDPFNLKRSLDGTDLVGTYNVMLVIPTVYWKASSDGKDLYLSSSTRYGSVGNMTAYAHTADGTVFPYIGIGVYEASEDGSRIVSVSGADPSQNRTNSDYLSRARQLTSAAGCGFQLVNLFQWTLFKAMAYAVMGTKNAKWMLGNGPTSGSSASVTGLADEAGPYADATSGYSKIFIENPYGSVGEMLGDACVIDGVLHAGQSLGGAETGGQPSTGVTVSITSSWKWVASMVKSSVGWDLPASSTSTDNHDDPAACGCGFAATTGTNGLFVGGEYNRSTMAGIGLTSYNVSTGWSGYREGTRISAFLNDYAVGLTDEAPAALMSAPLTLSMGQTTPDEEEAEEPEEESAEPTEEPTEEPEENYGEEEETPEETDTIEEDMR